MAKKIPTRITERFANIWVLLSDTDNFVSRSGLSRHYEQTLREWRKAVQENSQNSEKLREIKKEIVAFRGARRSEGWELRLGSLDIQLKGFRGDDALASGFRRMVLMVEKSGAIRYVVGSANHIELAKELEQQLSWVPHTELLHIHYLWYRRVAGAIELAGADSQPRDSQEYLKDYIDRHKSSLVKAMHKLV